MSRQVDKWIKKGRKHCEKGNHWFVIHYSDYLLCPICGAKKEAESMPEYNGYIVCEPTFEFAGGGG